MWGLCSVPYCLETGYVPTIVHHSFPSDPEMRKKWSELLQIPIDSITNNTKICSQHFEERDYLSTTHLKEDAIPSLFLTGNKSTETVLLTDDNLASILSEELPFPLSNNSNEDLIFEHVLSLSENVLEEQITEADELEVTSEDVGTFKAAEQSQLPKILPTIVPREESKSTVTTNVEKSTECFLNKSKDQRETVCHEIDQKFKKKSPKAKSRNFASVQLFNPVEVTVFPEKSVSRERKLQLSIIENILKKACEKDKKLVNAYSNFKHKRTLLSCRKFTPTQHKLSEPITLHTLCTDEINHGHILKKAPELVATYSNFKHKQTILNRRKLTPTQHELSEPPTLHTLSKDEISIRNPENMAENCLNNSTNPVLNKPSCIDGTVKNDASADCKFNQVELTIVPKKKRCEYKESSSQTVLPAQNIVPLYLGKRIASIDLIPDEKDLSKKTSDTNPQTHTKLIPVGKCLICGDDVNETNCVQTWSGKEVTEFGKILKLSLALVEFNAESSFCCKPCSSKVLKIFCDWVKINTHAILKEEANGYQDKVCIDCSVSLPTVEIFTFHLQRHLITQKPFRIRKRQTVSKSSDTGDERSTIQTCDDTVDLAATDTIKNAKPLVPFKAKDWRIKKVRSEDGATELHGCNSSLANKRIATRARESSDVTNESTYVMIDNHVGEEEEEEDINVGLLNKIISKNRATLSSDDEVSVRNKRDKILTELDNIDKKLSPNRRKQQLPKFDKINKNLVVVRKIDQSSETSDKWFHEFKSVGKLIPKPKSKEKSAQLFLNIGKYAEKLSIIDHMIMTDRMTQMNKNNKSNSHVEELVNIDDNPIVKPDERRHEKLYRKRMNIGSVDDEPSKKLKLVDLNKLVECSPAERANPASDSGVS